MPRIRKALAGIADQLGLNRPLLRRARKRYKKFHERAVRNHEGAEWSEARADELRAADYPEAARWRDKQAARRHHRAHRSSQKAQWWLGRVKVLNQRVHKLETRRDDLRAELERVGREVTIRGNTATGGTAGERFRAVALASAAACAANDRANFYSQPGAWDVDHVITGVSRDKRSDCSQWLTAVCKAAGLPDPNGADYTGGYTGTLVSGHNGWRQVSESEMRRRGWGFVIYGPGTAHHVEGYVGPGNRTIGHGSAPIDPGVIDLFGDGDYRCFTYN